MRPTREQLVSLLFEMLPGLYIGGWPAAVQACRVKLLGSRVYVVNLANGKPMVSRRGVMVKVNDDMKPNSIQILDKCIDQVVAAIRVEMEKGTPVIVHCHAGRQRSAAVIAAYIMTYEGLALDATIAYMKARKPDVFVPNVNFLVVLKRVEMDLQTTKK
jgi:protein-tyrosine phosphatase